MKPQVIKTNELWGVQEGKTNRAVSLLWSGEVVRKIQHKDKLANSFAYPGHWCFFLTEPRKEERAIKDGRNLEKRRQRNFVLLLLSHSAWELLKLTTKRREKEANKWIVVGGESRVKRLRKEVKAREQTKWERETTELLELFSDRLVFDSLLSIVVNLALCYRMPIFSSCFVSPASLRILLLCFPHHLPSLSVSCLILRFSCTPLFVSSYVCSLFVFILSPVSCLMPLPFL